jgi:hypothetical protein
VSGGLQLLIEDYLVLMKESRELDRYLPLLLSAMGHEIVHSAQKGVVEHGVDIASVGFDEDRKKKFFMWVVKCGTIGRQEWNVGSQSIRNSLEDAVDSYLQNNIAPQHRALPKKIVVVTNGEYRTNTTLEMVGYFKVLAKKHRIEVDRIPGSTLAAWTVAHLLDEHILPVERRQLFRRMLANVSQPDSCQAAGRKLIDSLLSDIGDLTQLSKNAARKKKLQALRGIRAALSVLRVHGMAADNLLGPYRLAEYALLAVWSVMHKQLTDGTSEVGNEFGGLMFEMVESASAYHQRMDPYYLTQDAFAYVLPHNLFVSRRIFDEVGRLGLQGCFWAWHDSTTAKPTGLHAVYAQRLRLLLKSHSGTKLPAFDDQATAIHHGLLLLAVTGHLEEAREWVHALCTRLAVAQQRRDLWPLTCSLEEALNIRFSFEEADDDACSCSILIPILLTWTAVLGIDEGYEYLRSTIIPNSSWTTNNLWSSDEGYDDLVASYRALFEHGVSESLNQPPPTRQEFLRSMSQPLAGVEPIDQSDWFKAGFAFLPMLAALHWGLQLPRQMLVLQAAAFVDGWPPAVEGSAVDDAPA